MNSHFSVVVNKSQVPGPVQEEADARSGVPIRDLGYLRCRYRGSL